MGLESCRWLLLINYYICDYKLEYTISSNTIRNSSQAVRTRAALASVAGISPLRAVSSTGQFDDDVDHSINDLAHNWKARLPQWRLRVIPALRFDAQCWTHGIKGPHRELLIDMRKGSARKSAAHLPVIAYADRLRRSQRCHPHSAFTRRLVSQWARSVQRRI